MAIVPDTKNWTWVLTRRCPDCGYDGSTYLCRDVAAGLRANIGEWRALLESPLACRRPSPDVWSALEYACHVRDVFRLFEVRLHLMLTQHDPTFLNWDQDKTALDDRYEEQDPVMVLEELERAGAKLAARFDAVPDDGWGRTGTRSDGSRFTIDTFARYFLHDPVHHVHDVRAGLEKLSGG